MGSDGHAASGDPTASAALRPRHCRKEWAEASGIVGVVLCRLMRNRTSPFVRQVNRLVSVPNWFTCDISLGSLSVYLDVEQCFKALGGKAQTSWPRHVQRCSEHDESHVSFVFRGVQGFRS